MIFMVPQAKDARGRKPGLHPDLLTVQGTYLDAGDMFWLAIDENDRVIGCCGYSSVKGTSEAVLHRLYVKADRKRQGVGSALLHTAEGHMRERGKSSVRVHLGAPKAQWREAYSFYPQHGYLENSGRCMYKGL